MTLMSPIPPRENVVAGTVLVLVLVDGGRNELFGCIRSGFSEETEEDGREHTQTKLDKG